jgi:hypothetical protein
MVLTDRGYDATGLECSSTSKAHGPTFLRSEIAKIPSASARIYIVRAIW